MVNQPKVCVGRVDDFGKVVDCVYPPAGDNLTEGKPEKNWCFLAKIKIFVCFDSTIPLTIKTLDNPTKLSIQVALKRLLENIQLLILHHPSKSATNG